MEMTTKMKIKSLKCVKKSTKLQENANKALKIPDTYTKLTTTLVITFPEQGLEDSGYLYEANN